jgi:hypothetical protein
VQEIDIHAPNLGSRPISLRIADPSHVALIVGWFNALVRSPRQIRLSDGHQLACAGGPAESVAFTFRRANGDELATANSAPGMASYCSPIQFTAGTHPEAFLLDQSTVGVDPWKLSGRSRDSFLARVGRLLGVTFRVSGYLG